MTTDKKPAPGDTSPQGNTSPQAAPQPAQTKPETAAAPAPKAPRTTKPKANPAEAILIAQEKRRAEEKNDELRRLNEDNLFYLRCPRNQHHQAIYLTEYPTHDSIHPGMWFSIEHRAGEPWHNPRVRCQECLVDGDQFSWLWLRAHQMPDGQVAFTLAHPRGVKKNADGAGAGHVYKISRTDLEERLGHSIDELFAPSAKGGE